MIQAARDLHTLLCHEPWYVTTSQGNGRLVIYVSRMPTPEERRKAPLAYGGYPVAFEYTRKPEPAPRS